MDDRLFEATDCPQVRYEGFFGKLFELRMRDLGPLLEGAYALEFGPGWGDSTEFLMRRFLFVMALDGSPTVLKNLGERFAAQVSAGKLALAEGMFEDPGLLEKVSGAQAYLFDTVVVDHVLEHVADPVAALRNASAFMDDGAVLFVGVPNAMSLNKQVAVELGVKRDVYSVDEAETDCGHARMYTPDLLRRHVAEAGLAVEREGGTLLKPLMGDAMAALGPERVEAFYRLGKRYPELCSEIWATARRRT